MGHGTRADHVHVQIQKAAVQMPSRFDERGVIAAPPERALAPDAVVLVSRERALQPVHGLGEVLRARRPYEKVDVV